MFAQAFEFRLEAATVFGSGRTAQAEGLGAAAGLTCDAAQVVLAQLPEPRPWALEYFVLSAGEAQEVVLSDRIVDFTRRLVAEPHEHFGVLMGELRGGRFFAFEERSLLEGSLGAVDAYHPDTVRPSQLEQCYDDFLVRLLADRFPDFRLMTFHSHALFSLEEFRADQSVTPEERRQIDASLEQILRSIRRGDWDLYFARLGLEPSVERVLHELKGPPSPGDLQEVSGTTHLIAARNVSECVPLHHVRSYSVDAEGQATVLPLRRAAALPSVDQREFDAHRWQIARSRREAELLFHGYFEQAGSRSVALNRVTTNGEPSLPPPAPQSGETSASLTRPSSGDWCQGNLPTIPADLPAPIV